MYEIAFRDVLLQKKLISVVGWFSIGTPQSVHKFLHLLAAKIAPPSFASDLIFCF